MSKSTKLHEAYAEIGESMAEAIKETAIGLSQAERKELAKELRYLKHHKHRH